MGWDIRSGNGNEDSIHANPCYGLESEFFTIELHHSGTFVYKKKLEYVGGTFCYVDYCCSDEMSKIELSLMAADVGLSGELTFYRSYLGRDDCSCLVPIDTDKDALEIGKFCDQDRIVGVFVDKEKFDMSDLQMNPTFSKKLPFIDEPLNFIGYCEKASDDSDGDVSYGEDSVHSDVLYDSEGQYYDDDYKEPETEELPDVSILKSKGKKPMTFTRNEKFADYEGKKSSTYYENCRVFNPKIGMDKIELEAEMCFTSLDIFRNAVRKHAVDEGRSIEFPTNNTTRIQVKCKNEECPFYIYIAKVPEDNTFQIKRIHFEHECERQPKVLQGDTRFLANQYADRIKGDPNWNVKSMLIETTSDCKVSFSKYQMFRVKKKIAKMDIGDDAKQFKMLRAYGGEILRSNPESTVKIKLKTIDKKSYFKRMYICWGALKNGMLNGCRKVILLDGCHVRTEYGGIILTAIGIDANNAMYPFAYAVVEKETKKSWGWFLDLVKSDLSITNPAGWTFMSDKQKGLVDAVQKIFDGCEHRFCVMHLYANFKLKYKGLTLKDLLWRAARATRVVDFERAMEELRETNEKAHEWISKRPPENWSKAYFGTVAKSDILLNNLSESFNGSIAAIRALPILYMLEGFRMKLMKKIGEKRCKMMRYRGTLCPRIAAIFEQNLKYSMEFTAHWNGHEQFNVQKPGFGSTYVVHLNERFCSCRRWQLTGIPCAHAICGLKEVGYKFENYIDKCYTKETYLQIYSHYIMPIASPEEWLVPNQELNEILPPIIQTQPGRPKEFKRKLQPGEKKGKIIVGDKKVGKLSKHGVKMHCSLCSNDDHNKRSCPNRLTIEAKRSLDIPVGNKSKSKSTHGNKVQKKQSDSTSTSKFSDVVQNKVAGGKFSQEEPIIPKRAGVTKLQIKRKVDSWFECSNAGITSSQPSLASSQQFNGSYLSQPVGKYSRHVGEASFGKKPTRSSKTYKTIGGEEQPLI